MRNERTIICMVVFMKTGGQDREDGPPAARIGHVHLPTLLLGDMDMDMDNQQN